MMTAMVLTASVMGVAGGFALPEIVQGLIALVHGLLRSIGMIGPYG